MKKLLLAALMAGFYAVTLAPASAQTTSAPDQTEPAAAPADRPARPLTKAEQKRRQKVRKRTGPVVYKGRIAEQSEFLTDTGLDDDKTTKTKNKRKTDRRRD